MEPSSSPTRARLALAAAVAAAALAAAGCGGGDDEPETTATTTAEASGATGATGEEEELGVVSNTVEVTITEDALEPSNADPGSLLPGETVTSTATEGEVTFELTNEASEPKSVVFNLGGKEIPLAEDLAPGDSTTKTLDVTLGFHVYYDADEGPTGPKAQLEVNEEE